MVSAATSEAGSPRRGDVYLVVLSPTRGREIRKTRPCVVVSPDELNAHIGTVVVGPLTTGSPAYPYRIACQFLGKEGHGVLDQQRTSITAVSRRSSER